VTLETRCGNTAGFFLFILAKVGFAKVGFAKVSLPIRCRRENRPLFVAKKVQSAKELIIHVEYRFTALSAVFIWRCT